MKWFLRCLQRFTQWFHVPITNSKKIVKIDLLRTSECDRTDCPVCMKEGKENCRNLDVNYFMTCENCGHDRVYKGTPTRDGHVRGKEHIADMKSKKEKSDMLRHCVEKHNREIREFWMDIIDTLKRDPMLRQVTESVRISRTKKEQLIIKKEEYSSTQHRWRQIHDDTNTMKNATFSRI